MRLLKKPTHPSFADRHYVAGPDEQYWNGDWDIFLSY
jgi:hypothetical protein